MIIIYLLYINIHMTYKKTFLLLSLLLILSFSNDITIAIIGTNDIHGTAFPAQMIRADN
jgi:hypothetical protein